MSDDDQSRSLQLLLPQQYPTRHHQKTMNTPRSNLISIATLTMISAVLVFLSAGQTQAQYSSPVRVVNAPSQPAQTRDVDTPRRQPFHGSATFSFTAGSAFATGVFDFTVPAGKRAVIEFVSANGSLPSGQQINEAEVVTNMFLTGGGTGQKRHTVLVNTQATSVLDRFVISQPILQYADLGTPEIRLNRGATTGTGAFEASISGHLIDTP
jgi:hypothetical protein